MTHSRELSFIATRRKDTETIGKALEIQPKNVDSRRLAARLAAKAGDHETALTQFDFAIASRPDRIEAYIEQGELLQKLSRWSEAIDSYSLAMRIDPYWMPLKEAVRQCEEQIGGQTG